MFSEEDVLCWQFSGLVLENSFYLMSILNTENFADRLNQDL